MNLDIQFKINNNDNYKKFIRENSYWYKVLNRNPELFNTFADDMKEKYRLRFSDRISNFNEQIDVISTLLNSLK